MDDLVPILVPIVVVATLAFAVVATTKVVSDGRTHRRLIDKGATTEMAAAVATVSREHAGLYDTLRWALVIGGIGLALSLVQFLPYGAGDPIVYGIVLVFAAGGLFIYYAVARRMAKR